LRKMPTGVLRKRSHRLHGGAPAAVRRVTIGIGEVFDAHQGGTAAGWRSLHALA
jgi:hypothetical protein